MTEQLPISIDVCNDLRFQFDKITSVGNKLEAQFNFQTMTANWYSDEDNILFIQLCIETPQSFEVQKKIQSQYEIQHYSDDAFSYNNSSKKKQALICHIAITNTELTMLNQQNKLLTGLLRVKLHKVLNIVAKQLKLTTI